MKFLKRALLALVAVGMIGSFAPTASAAEGESIAMSPTSKRFSLDPGAAANDSLSVINDGTVPYAVRIYARPYSVDGENYNPVFSKLSPVTDAYEWVVFDKTEFTLAPGETAKVPFTITVPKNADGGGHYGVIFAETQPATGDNSSVVRKKRVGAIVYATVKGDNRSSGEVISQDISFLQTKAPLSATARVQNNGNVDFVDTTTMRIQTVFGVEKYLSERQLAVLPGTVRKIDYEWKDGSTFGLYNVTVSHTILGKTTSTSSYVLIIPTWAIILLIGLVVAGIAYLAVRPKLTKKSKRVKKASRKK